MSNIKTVIKIYEQKSIAELHKSIQILDNKIKKQRKQLVDSHNRDLQQKIIDNICKFIVLVGILDSKTKKCEA